MDFIRSVALVNTENLKKNVENVYKFSNKKIFAVVKADAYGHDAEIVSKALSSLDFIEGFCVATAYEGYLLRNFGIEKSIIVLGGILKQELELFNQCSLIPVISDFFHLEVAENLKFKKIHIKFDTGMRRLGFYGSDIEKLKEKIKGFEIEGILSHLPSADTDPEYTKNQIEDFKRILKKIDINPKYIHIQNSAGVVYDCPFCNTIRLGIAMYGEKPTQNYPIDLYPVMTVLSKVISVKNIKKGDKISYCGTFTADRDMKVAVVSFGYADGLPRALSNKGYVLINGKYCKILGNVTMDMTIVDVSDLDVVNVGDDVVIVGKSKDKEIKFSDIANLSGTIAYEIMCGISKRVVREEVK
ncbi:alanine racemase [Sulfurihydrogenibium subterraneum]|uniref:alanine racemase n=1 Tax=Sulfurihydrogenibium subterraneum TaxID=171121 RepID=UPI000686B59E|nr:alanine racemase [Sulfurihydrogenibium subterraneum]